MKHIISVPLDFQDNIDIERALYEVQVQKQLIDYFIQICKDRNCMDKLSFYIDDYVEDLKIAELHKQMLSNKIMKSYFPKNKDLDKNKTTYIINSEDGVIQYFYED